VVVALFCLGWIFWLLKSKASAPASSATASSAPVAASSTDDLGPTVLYAHNIRLRKGPNFRIYIRWIHGQMLRTQAKVTPTFDDPDSFVLLIQKGVIRVNIGDIANYFNASLPPDSPFTNISIEPDGNQVKIHGTAHKVVPIPVELEGSLTATPDGYVQFHANKISALKIPVKGLLGGLHLQLSDLVHSTKFPGIQVSGNDIIFNTEKVLPPPHIRGLLTAINVKPPDIEVIYGNAPDDDAQLAKWHNFLRLTGGTLAFGKLTMHHTDLTMIDASHDPWFNLDLVNYQAQIVNGYTRMTAQAGLEIFMPDLDEKTLPKAAQRISLEWLKDRNLSLPPDVSAATTNK
jgi:hypothetical protein